MLTGDYTMQCRKHVGTCNCERCTRAAASRATSERRRWYYEQVLSVYAKQLRDNPSDYQEELRMAEVFVDSLRDTAVDKKSAQANARRQKSTWQRAS